MSDHGNGLRQRGGPIGGWKGLMGVGRKKIENAQMLGGKDPVQALEAERTFAIQEVGDVCLLESGGAGQGRTGEEPAVDAAKDF